MAQVECIPSSHIHHRMPSDLINRIVLDSVLLRRREMGWTDGLLRDVRLYYSNKSYHAVLVQLVDMLEDADMPDLITVYSDEEDETPFTNEDSAAWHISNASGVSFDTALLLLQEVGYEEAIESAIQMMVQ